MDPRPRRPRLLGDATHVLDDAGLVVREHHRHDAGRFLQGGRNVVEIDLTFGRDRELAHFPAQACQLLRGLRDARVLDSAHRHLRRLEIPRRAFDKEIVRFGPAGDENHLRSLHVHERRHLLARRVDGFSRLRAELVAARRIAVLIPQERQHGFEHALVEPCRRVVVEVDVFHHPFTR
jgi:hypothetical protein